MGLLGDCDQFLIEISKSEGNVLEKRMVCEYGCCCCSVKRSEELLWEKQSDPIFV